MRYFTAVLFLYFIFCGAISTNASPDVAGTWALYAMDRDEITDATRLELKVEGNAVTGKGIGLILTGTVDGDDLNLTATREDHRPMGTFKIHVEGANAKGVVQRGNESRDIKLHRLPTRSTPKTVTFEPKIYHRLFATTEPALKINAGDTVVTTTVDALGRDGADVSRSPGGNPQTGPIYVDGAIPSDTLAVTIKRIRLNKSIARSGNTIMQSALTTDYNQDSKLDHLVDGKWSLDTTNGTASLAHPSERLKNFKITLKPMIGCIGVAPARGEAFRTQQLGAWGGNMDYNGLTEGTTVYLPVSREGALLYVGDVHAREGDGELTGDALETSAELELQIDVVPGPATSGPRAENAEYLMSMGIAGSMEAAMRQATTQLTRWIEHDYQLTSSEAALVLGTSMEYQIAEVVDPQMNIVSRIPKSVLAPLKIQSSESGIDQPKK